MKKAALHDVSVSLVRALGSFASLPHPLFSMLYETELFECVIVMLYSNIEKWGWGDIAALILFSFTTLLYRFYSTHSTLEENGYINSFWETAYRVV